MAATILLVGIAVAVVYPLLMRVILDRVQPLRLKLAELGNQLLESSTLPEAHKRVVVGMLDDAFEWRFMFSALYSFPVFAWTRLRGRRLSDPFAQIRNTDDKDKMLEMTGRFAASVVAANPLVAFVVALEFAVIALLLSITRKIDHGLEGIKSAGLRGVARVEEARASEGAH